MANFNERKKCKKFYAISQPAHNMRPLFRFDGEHTKGEGDKKWVTYAGYSKFFTNKTIEELRVSPNPMDALMACKQAFSIQDQWKRSWDCIQLFSIFEPILVVLNEVKCCLKLL